MDRGCRYHCPLLYGIVKPESLAAWIADKPIRSEAAEAVLEAAVQGLALELEDGEGLEP